MTTWYGEGGAMQTMVIRIDEQAEDQRVRARSRAPRPVHQPAPAAPLITADPPVHALPRHPEPAATSLTVFLGVALSRSRPPRQWRPRGQSHTIGYADHWRGAHSPGVRRLREVRRGAAVPQGQNRYRRVLVPWLPRLQTGLAHHL